MPGYAVAATANGDQQLVVSGKRHTGHYVSHTRAARNQ
jgi:hypothetical protein